MVLILEVCEVHSFSVLIQLAFSLHVVATILVLYMPLLLAVRDLANKVNTAVMQADCDKRSVLTMKLQICFAIWKKKKKEKKLLCYIKHFPYFYICRRNKKIDLREMQVDYKKKRLNFKRLKKLIKYKTKTVDWI
jgi:hypothetical protein